jgi:hypothetical protein
LDEIAPAVLEEYCCLDKFCDRQTMEKWSNISDVIRLVIVYGKWKMDNIRLMNDKYEIGFV